MHRFFVPKKNIQGVRGKIDGQELEHLRKVLRLRPGDHITVFDDSGYEHEAIIRSFAVERCEIEIISSDRIERESPLDMTLAVGLTKGEKMDFVVEKATELGVQVIAPFVSAFTVPKLDNDKVERRTARWQKIALSAAKQSARSRIPEIRPLCKFGDFVQQSFPDGVKLLFWEKEEQRTLLDLSREKNNVRSALLVVGAEGGFNETEANAAREHGFNLMSLGPRILRAETAALTAVSLVQFLWGDLG